MLKSHEERPSGEESGPGSAKLYWNAGINGNFPTAQVSQLTTFLL